MRGQWTDEQSARGDQSDYEASGRRTSAMPTRPLTYATLPILSVDPHSGWDLQWLCSGPLSQGLPAARRPAASACSSGIAPDACAARLCVRVAHCSSMVLQGLACVPARSCPPQALSGPPGPCSSIGPGRACH